MDKIILNLIGNLVTIEIPSTMEKCEIEDKLKNLMVKNHNLLKTMQYYKVITSISNSKHILYFESIVKSVLNLKLLEEGENSNVVKKKSKNYVLHYGNLRSGEMINSNDNVIILGNLNPGSYVKSKKSIFVYGKVRGTLHAGSNNTKYQSSFIYIEDAKEPKIKIGSEQFDYSENENFEKVILKKNKGIISKESINRVKILKLLRKLGIELL